MPARLPMQVVRRLIDEGFSGGRLEVADELIARRWSSTRTTAPTTRPAPRA